MSLGAYVDETPDLCLQLPKSGTSEVRHSS